MARSLTWLLAALYSVLGVVLFAAPDWASANFAWTISPLVAMTIGGWCLGNAWAAGVVAHRWQLPLAMSGMVCLALFGILETGVLIAFVGKLRLGHWLAWLYVGTLALNVIAAALWAFEVAKRRDELRQPTRRFGVVGTIVGGLFVVLVSVLGLYGLFAPDGSRGLYAGVFPEIITPFTLRAFGALYLSIGLAPLVLLARRDLRMTLSHIFLSWGYILFITVAAFVFIDSFDFTGRPGQYLYIGAYLLVGVPTLLAILFLGTGRRQF